MCSSQPSPQNRGKLTIQFIRYLPLLRQTASCRIIFECQPELATLVKDSVPKGIQLVTSTVDSTAYPEFDQHLALLSLPLALQQFNPLPLISACLFADHTCRGQWRERMTSGSGFRVGLAWAGNPKNRSDSRRSIPFEQLRSILMVPDIHFYSLQVKPTPALPREVMPPQLIDLTDKITDFADTAAFMAELDLIISVDTAAAHLAGALGRPVWTLLPFVPDWRWGLEREDTPWYPTMRLFRQRTAGDWASVLRRVADALTAYAAGVSPAAAGQTAPGGA